MKPLISVNICTYNRKKLLKKTIDSLLNQNIDEHFSYEIIIIDDGSTDDTKILINDITTASKIKIKYFYKEKHGIADARNRGLNESSGEWIAFIDDDEIADSNWLNELMKTAISESADCVGGAIQLLIPESSVVEVKSATRKHLGESLASNPFKNIFNYKGPGTGNVLVHKSVFDKIGSFNSAFYDAGEDQDFFIRARSAGFFIAFTSDAIVYHVITEDRLSDDSLKLTAKKNGTSLAYFDWRDRGALKTTLISLIRIAHSIFFIFSRYLWFFLKRDKGHILSSKCSIWTMKAYICYVFDRLTLNKNK